MLPTLSFELPDNAHLATFAVTAFTSYLAILSIYRLFFHRISHIPGPKLAALTYYYQAYYDVYPHKGKWLFHQISLHEKYGPIMRVGPDEIHIADPDFYAEFAGSATKRRDKSPLWYWFAGNEDFIGTSAFATLNHRHHRLRRAVMEPFFSLKKVRELEGRVKVHVEKLRKVVLGFGGREEVCNLSAAMSAVTLDVISEYSFGKSTCSLDTPDLGEPMRRLLEAGVQIHPFARAFPTLVLGMMKITGWLAPFLPFMNAQKLFKDIEVELVRPPYDKALQGGSQDDETSIVQALATTKSLSANEKTFSRVAGEALNLIGAGTETTGRTLAVALFHILDNPQIHANLLAELRTLMPTATSPLPPVTALSKLTYLTATIQEVTRIAHGVAGRLVRIAPDTDLVCHGHLIPKGTTFGMSHYIQHTDENVFSNPEEFHPERFHGDGAAERLRYLVPFGKGPRMCLGMNLAWSEMYLCLAALVGGVKMELYETGARDVTVDQEFFLGVYPADSKGVRVRVLGLQDERSILDHRQTS